MEKNSIGQFITALRKANGMTQQDVADRLNVSNKAVSRWERNECAPDLSVIPALAEMFEVTCDELLKGERIPEATFSDRKKPKVEKQVKILITRTLSGFKTLIYISLAVAIIGLVCMFGISYGFYRPIIGFAVMLLFETCAFIIAVLAVTRTKDVKTDNELFETADDKLIYKFNKTLGTLSFAAFYVILAVITLSLPLILISFDYAYSVVTPYSYFTVFLGGIVLILTLVYLKCKTPYMNWVTGGQLLQKINSPTAKSIKTMTVIQIALTVLAAVIFIFAPYFSYSTNNTNETLFLYNIIISVGLACLIASIVCFFIFLIRHKDGRKDIILFGIRNIFLLLPALIVSQMHSVSWISYSPDEDSWAADTISRYDNWNIEYLFYALASAAIIIIVFSLIDRAVKRTSKKS